MSHPQGWLFLYVEQAQIHFIDAAYLAAVF